MGAVAWSPDGTKLVATTWTIEKGRGVVGWVHLWDFYRGDSAQLRLRPARALPEWDEADPLTDRERQVLRLMILAKGLPSNPTPNIIEAHRTAVAPLTELVSQHHDPGDHELLGICHVMLGNVESADAIFRAGLNLERQRNAGSDLCGSFMKRISML